MAAVTINNADQSRSIRHLENVTISNQTANSTAVTKAVRVPTWAKSMTFYIFFDSAGGTSPLFDFVVGRPDFGSTTRFQAPSDDNDIATLGNTPWNGITQESGTSAKVIEVHIGPDFTDDDTGDLYFVKAILPPWVTYTYTTDGTTDDEDYAFRIVAVFRPY
jgi:hypothetical protein